MINGGEMLDLLFKEPISNDLRALRLNFLEFLCRKCFSLSQLVSSARRRDGFKEEKKNGQGKLSVSHLLTAVSVLL